MDVRIVMGYQDIERQKLLGNALMYLSSGTPPSDINVVMNLEPSSYVHKA